MPLMAARPKQLLLFLLLLQALQAPAQKNALGLSAGYSYFNHKVWNGLQDTYHQVFDTVQHQHPYLHHLPTASLVYERQLAEYLYAQPFLQYQYGSTTSQNGSVTLALKVHFLAAGAGVNLYPFKMANGIKKTALNPFYLRAGIAANYSLSSITRNGKSAIDDSTSAQRGDLTIMAEAGFGYDLHFGKRCVLQPFFGARFYPNMRMQAMAYFIDSIKRYDQEDTGLALAYIGRVTLLILF